MTSTLEIKDLHVSIEGKEIVKGVSLIVNQGEIHAVMGPNGSGKSTLANTIAGHPKYKVTSGEILLDGQNIAGMTADKRAKLGLFLAFQYPVTVPGVSFFNFLRSAYNSIKGTSNTPQTGEQQASSFFQFKELIDTNMKLLKIDETFASRYVNEGLSGGEKKRLEILQLAILKPKFAVLDETDSGLDIDALKIVAEGINTLAGPEMGVLLITHYHRILNYVKPQYVHVMTDGKIAMSGGEELAAQLEEKGYAWLKEAPAT